MSLLLTLNTGSCRLVQLDPYTSDHGAISDIHEEISCVISHKPDRNCISDSPVVHSVGDFSRHRYHPKLEMWS